MLLSSLRAIGRYIISKWLLIIIFCCLGAYLIFPGPFDPLSSVLFPDGTGHGVRISYIVSGATAYPGIVSLNITIMNVDNIIHDYVFMGLIGSSANGSWWGPGYYRDGLSAATGVQNAINDWYSEALISTGPMRPGQSFQVTRKIEIPNGPRITDTLVVVYDKQDASKSLAWQTKLGIINSGR